MKIAKVETSQSVIALYKPFKTALRTATSIEVLLVKIVLENGIHGIGAASATWKITGDSLTSIEQTINGPIKDVILHRDVEDLESIIHDVQCCCVGNTSAKASVDIALHDAFCKIISLPLYRLFGGQTNIVETDITIGIDEPNIMQNDARELTKQGYNVLKIKVGHDEKIDLKRIRHIRKVVDPHVQFRLDANQGWEAKQAVRLIQQLEDEELGIELIEQPVRANDYEGLKFIRDRVNTPIMADESIFSPSDAFRLLKEEAVDLLNIKLMKCGGLRNAFQIADMAAGAGVECMIGSMMESSVSVAAAAHIATAHKNITRYDLDAPLWIENESMKSGIRYDKNYISLTDRPGLGF